jgi:redox-sensitive bicupin YhaK (pirin superfamily)
VSPGDLGQVIKPFVFLDLATPEPGPSALMRWHPHSGIATVTVLIEGEVTYRETTGASGLLASGAVEWMAANAGVWHTGAPVGQVRLLALQLWIALPPEWETLPPSSCYLDSHQVPHAGPARIILGTWGGVQSTIGAPPGLTYIDVRLAAGQKWTFTPPPGQLVAWLAVYTGALMCSEPADCGELLVFEESEHQIEILAVSDVGFVIGSALKHPYDLHIGNHSVHTSAAALSLGEAEIARIATSLREASILAPARGA